jgi:hypothetical protein
VLKKNTHLVECAQYIAGRQIPRPKPTPYDGLDEREAWNKEIWDTVRKDRRARMQTRNAHRHDLGGIKV